jgi:hypothetical protein
MPLPFTTNTRIAQLTLALAGLLAGAAHADGLADLKAALGRLPGQTPVKAQLEVKTWSRSGEGKEAQEHSGLASVAVEDGARGLQVLYAKDMLGRVEQEERAASKDPNKAKTPTLQALREMRSTELNPMLSAAASLARDIDEASFSGEKADSYNGKPARLLSFAYSVDKLSDKDRKYVKNFESVLEVWIAADGTPLASRRRDNVSGRAFVVVSFEAKSEEERVYQQVGDRLLTLRRESHSSSSGAGEKSESRVVKTLQLQS